VAALTPFYFEARASPLHRIHPVSKFVSLLALSWASMRGSPAALVGLAACAVILLVAMTGAKLRHLSVAVRFLAWLGPFVVVLKCLDFDSDLFINTNEVGPAFLYVGRLATVLLLADLYFRVTGSRALGDAVSGLFRSIFCTDRLDPGLYLGLAMRFVPLCFESYQRVKEAAVVRGFSARRARYTGLVRIFESYLVKMIRSAVWTARALEARCYDPARTIERPPLRLPDLILPLAALLAGAAIVVAK
jgi:energy-coupling factor transporter transmembrane protein EcfT